MLSGDHAGWETGPSAVVTGRGSPPSSGARNSCGGPSRRDVYANQRPSGDQRGDAALGPAAKRRAGVLPSLGATQIMVRVREIFRTEIATAAIFDTPTVAGFAEALTAQEPKPGQIEKIAQLHQRIKHLSKADLQKMVQQNKQQ